MNPVWVKVADNGRIGLPAEIRRRAGLSKGDELVTRVEEEGVVTLMTAEAAVRRVQRMARELFGDKLPTVDEYLAEKREDVAREERKMQHMLGEIPADIDEIA
jgi:AbrB family looped-hinge helix DNA binding protein